MLFISLFCMNGDEWRIQGGERNGGQLPPPPFCTYFFILFTENGTSTGIIVTLLCNCAIGDVTPLLSPFMTLLC